MTPQVDVELGYEGDDLVQVAISGALGYAELMSAAKQLQALAHKHQHNTFRSSPEGSAVTEMVHAYHAGNGRVSDEYLARLAAAYAELAPARRDVSTALASALDKPLPTVKGHIMRARQQGFLTKADPGKEGGQITDKTKELLK